MEYIKAALLIFFLAVAQMCQADAPELIVSFRGTWKFYIGDNETFANPGYNDSKWDDINVPGSWEDEGFPGYDGFAWYRKTFDLDIDTKNNYAAVTLGMIDDVDEVFVNGHKIGGRGSFPPNYQTAHNQIRVYNVPVNFLNSKGKNLIAVRVYDHTGPGGITVAKKSGIYLLKDELCDYHVQLSGTWKFMTGHNEKWALPEIIDSEWPEIQVPGKWEDQGYDDYNGWAWYRKTVSVAEIRKQHLILNLGQIDDFDRVYFNGELVGSTMLDNQGEHPDRQNEDWQEDRAYLVPKDLVNWGGYNTIAVCVYDGYGDGGIRSGIIELLSREEFLFVQKNFTYGLTDILDIIFD